MNNKSLMNEALIELLARTARPLKAQEIASTLSKELGFPIPKGDVNSILYGMMTSGLAVRDKEIRWTVVGDAQLAPVSIKPQIDTRVSRSGTGRISTAIRKGRSASVTSDATGLFGTALADALDKKCMTLRELAVEVEISYEHVRKLLKGLAYPSAANLKQICKAVGLPYGEMNRLVTQDKMRSKFGKSLSAVMNRNPQAVAFDELTARLTPDEASSFMEQMRAVINQRKKLQ